MINEDKVCFQGQMMKRICDFLSIALFTGSLLVAAPVVFPICAAAAESVGREGEVVPFFSVKDVEGEQFDLRLRARQNTVVLFFWSSYRTMSIREMNFLNDMGRFYNLYGLEIAAVEGRGLAADQVREELEKLKVIGTEPAYTVLPDPGGSLSRQYRVVEIPETFIIGRQGKVLFHLRGFREEDGARLETGIKEILGLLPVPREAPGNSRPSLSPRRQEAERRGVSVDPEKELFEKYRYFGNYYFKSGNTELALDNYRRCLEVDPKSIEVNLRIGEVYAALKEYEKARKAWEAVLKIDPDNREADTLIRRLIRGEF
jgi:tetratricopeptide (TPR) repeat protein